MTHYSLTACRILAVMHILVAIILSPSLLFFSFISAPLVLPAQLWLFCLGIMLWKPRVKLVRLLRYTHFVLAPYALLMIVFGIGALRDAHRSAAAGGGLLGAFGLIPLTIGICAGGLSLFSLYMASTDCLASASGRVVTDHAIAKKGEIS